jgi:bacterioferritin-associated ferredoxin
MESACVYICICNAIREKDFREVARKCPGDTDAVYACMGKQAQCGQCLDDAAEILIEERFGEGAMARV